MALGIVGMTGGGGGVEAASLPLLRMKTPIKIFDFLSLGRW